MNGHRVVGCLLLAGTMLHAAEYHVAKNGKDANCGSRAEPFLKIQKAADVAQPGDTVTVHEGVYRERINPPRGGAAKNRRIVYRAAPGEKAEIKGSEVVKGWTKIREGVWKVTLPNVFFGGFNPFADEVAGDWFNPKGRKHHTAAVYLNGEWLTEAEKLDAQFRPVSATARRAKPGVLLNVAWLKPGEGERIPAVSYVTQSGVKNAPCEEGGECVGWIDEGDWFRYDGVDFGSGTEQVEIRSASATKGGMIELRLGGPDGQLLGTSLIPNTGGWQSWRSFTAKITPVTGVRTLCLTFRGAPETQSPCEALWFAEADEEKTTIWADFGNADPNKELVEVNVRRTVFYPDKPGRNYITVRGFTLRHAATPWAPPTAEQIGLIGTHWSKGWIIENNTISHSVCTGITLGKHGDEFDNTSANSAEGYVKTIERAHAYPIPWTKATIGGHMVRNNHISHCEQAGIVGSLGCSFSTVTDNTIHDIHVRRLFTGAEMAGIKFHGAIDTEISRNHICRTCRGLWLDWMSQGTRVSQNLFHDNSEDVFLEVNHGPLVVDNNVLLSVKSLRDNSQGCAFVHNLLGGSFSCKPQGRITPYHKAHSTEVAGMETTRCGDNRFINNIFLQDVLGIYDGKLPNLQAGNVFAKEGISFDAEEMCISLSATLREAVADQACKVVTSEMLGRAKFPDLPYADVDGKPLCIDSDYFGKQRDPHGPTPGPFENPGSGRLRLKVWPTAKLR